MLLYKSTAKDVYKRQDISSEWVTGLKSSLWEIYEDGDKQPTYSLKWKYKNVYYELLGKISRQELEKIAQEILF